MSLACAYDPVRFAQAVGFDPDPWQARALRYSGRRLLLNCSRQAGKSQAIGLRAAHRAVFIPHSLVLCVAPTLRQSTNLFEKVSRAVDAYKGGPKRLDQNAMSLRLSNGSRVIALPGEADTIRGYSPHVVLVDEASFVQDGLFAAVTPMLIVSKGELVVLSTPNGKRGYFYEQWVNGGDDWDRIAVPANDCPRISPAELAHEKATMPHWLFRQEYECEFVETLDAVFRSDDIARAQVTPEKQRIARPAAPWETAA